jgi:hypothetical protein
MRNDHIEDCEGWHDKAKRETAQWERYEDAPSGKLSSLLAYLFTSGLAGDRYIIRSHLSASAWQLAHAELYALWVVYIN